MNFGDGIKPAEATDPAAWIDSARHDSVGVGGLVPNHFEAVVRVPAPDPNLDLEDADWWSMYRDVHCSITSIGARHTSTPDRAWLAIWEGHGFDNFSSHIAYAGPKEKNLRRALQQKRARDRKRAELREADRKQKIEIRKVLAKFPLFDLPNRAYYLMEAPLTAVPNLSYPGSQGWRNPDLIWPDDRSWFIGTDVDFWSLFVGGDGTFIDELLRNIPKARLVEWDEPLPIEN